MTGFSIGLAAEMAETSRRAAAEPHAEAALRLIVDTAMTLLHVDAAGITLREKDGSYRSMATSSDLVRQADSLQYGFGEGPCVQAAIQESIVVSENVAMDERWPKWGPAAAGLGISSVLSADLFLPSSPVGALNLYALRHREFTVTDLHTAHVLAAHTSVAMARSQSEADLWQAIDSRHLIGTAQGILMNKHHITSDQAFSVLRRYSQQHNTKLHLVAEYVLAVGHLPDQPLPSELLPHPRERRVTPLSDEHPLPGPWWPQNIANMGALPDIESLPYRAAVDGTPMLVTFMIDNTVVYANPAFESFLGIPVGKSRGRPSTDLIHPSTFDADTRRFRNVDTPATPGTFDTILIHTDGTHRQVESVEHPIQIDGRSGICLYSWDVSDRAKREETLLYAATHDHLTGLVNRALLLDRLALATARIGRSCVAVMVLFLDLDNFKVVNDDHGHSTGDQVLRQIADNLQKPIRATDTVARISGDEFVICADLNKVGDAAVIHAKVKQALTRPIILGDRSFAVHASIGVLVVTESAPPHQLLAEADRLMYVNKQLRQHNTTTSHQPD